MVLQKQVSLKQTNKGRFPLVMLHLLSGYAHSRSSCARAVFNCVFFPLTFGELGLGLIKLMMFHTQLLKCKIFLREKIGFVTSTETSKPPDDVQNSCSSMTLLIWQIQVHEGKQSEPSLRQNNSDHRKYTPASNTS